MAIPTCAAVERLARVVADLGLRWSPGFGVGEASENDIERKIESRTKT